MLFCLDPNAGASYLAAQDTYKQTWKHIDILAQMLQAPSTSKQRRAGEITTKTSSKLPQKCFPFLPEKHYFQSSPSCTSQMLLACTSQWTTSLWSFLYIFESIIL